jgi:5'-nucleotidase
MEEFTASKNRRNFIKNSFLGILGASQIPLDLFAKEDVIKLTVLHTNDVHSHIDPFPENDPKFAGLGGVARRATLVKRIRETEKNVLLLDAGDIYQGTPYFNRYGGELEVKLMSKMGYDASAIGNHDFDNGIDGIVKNLPLFNFPLLCANYDFSSTELDGKTSEYKIFEKDGLKIGVFGLGIELEGLVDRRMYGKTKYNEPEVVSAKMAIFLKNEKKCDLIICLSHLGYKYQERKISDVELAKQSRFIDIIIGGHTHTFLDKPVLYKNRDGKEVHICQVGWAGIKLGRLDITFDRGSKKTKKIEGTSMNVYQKHFFSSLI